MTDDERETGSESGNDREGTSARAEWVTVGSYPSGLEADIARAVLEAEGIPVFVQGNSPGIFGLAFQGTIAGGIELLPGFVLTYSRVAVILFAAVVVAFVWIMLQRTPLGLHVRAVTQNRSMAASMGISTRRVDMWTFGIGSGVAGLGGVALSQLGNVGPELGQGYIVDSFMVVVLGGVGKLAGTLAGAFGLGIVNKLLEPVAGAVLGKIAILVFIILFIQRRPQGIFALKGRAAEVS
jgi:urea transport system permease protein